MSRHVIYMYVDILNSTNNIKPSSISLWSNRQIVLTINVWCTRLEINTMLENEWKLILYSKEDLLYVFMLYIICHIIFFWLFSTEHIKRIFNITCFFWVYLSFTKPTPKRFIHKICPKTKINKLSVGCKHITSMRRIWILETYTYVLYICYLIWFFLVYLLVVKQESKKNKTFWNNICVIWCFWWKSAKSKKNIYLL